MKKAIFVPADNNLEYYKYTFPFIENYAKKYKYDLHFQKKSIPESPASWLKLICHRYINADFIVCMDADIIPLLNACSFENDFVFDKLNLCVDAIIYKKEKRYDNNLWYNCGLIGISSNYFELFDSLFEKNKYILCWEQFPVNNEIFDKKIPVNVLSDKWNYMIRFDEKSQDPNFFVNFKHITSGRDPHQRLLWAKNHYFHYKDDLDEHSQNALRKLLI